MMKYAKHSKINKLSSVILNKILIQNNANNWNKKLRILKSNFLNKKKEIDSLTSERDILLNNYELMN